MCCFLKCVQQLHAISATSTDCYLSCLLGTLPACTVWYFTAVHRVGYGHVARHGAAAANRAICCCSCHVSSVPAMMLQVPCDESYCVAAAYGAVFRWIYPPALRHCACVKVCTHVYAYVCACIIGSNQQGRGDHCSAVCRAC